MLTLAAHARTLRVVWFFFDESGNFEFPANRFDAYTQAVVICPDSKLAAAETYVAERAAEWDLRELHAAELSDDQLFAVCRFMRKLGLPALVAATDTTAVTLKDIEEHRLKQAVQLHGNFETWRDAGGQGDSIPRWFNRRVNETIYPTRVSHSEWVQTDLLLNMFHNAINKSIGFHLDDKYRPDFEEFRFVLDSKLPGKLAPGEKHFDEVLRGFLASNPERVAIFGVREWAEPPVHPFHANFSASDGIDLRKLIRHGLEFEPSHEHAGLQLADVLAHTARRRIMHPENETITWAWQTVKPLVRTDQGRYLYLRGYGTGGEAADLDRYRGIQTDG